jgi:3-phosphoglycerate kinase
MFVVCPAHASIVGVAKYIPRRYAGLLMHKELTFLGRALEYPTRPLAAVVGGAKVSTKLAILRNLLDRVDKLIVGGGMAFTFYRALGYSVGDSVAEEELVAQADEIMKTAEQRGCSLVLAVDSHIVSTEQLRGKALRTSATYLPKRAVMLPRIHAGLGKEDGGKAEAFAEGTQYVSPAEAGHFVLNEAIPDGYTAVDIGTKSIENFCKELEPCRTVLWNGTPQDPLVYPNLTPS